MLEGKAIVVGVCGGIAAYKVVEVVSRLRKLNASVYVIMTKNATEFVSPLTFQSISNNPVTVDMFASPKTWEVEHISLARKADLIVVAPATANVIGKVSGGVADDMLTTTVMATKVPVLFVPAMNYGMYENPIVQDNIKKLTGLGYKIMEPDTGVMAAENEYGKGRLPEPKKIVDDILDMMTVYSPLEKGCTETSRINKNLEGVKILVTAGPTREAIDPVRYISNHSSGKMGYAIAKAASKRGAYVKLISGPVNIEVPDCVDVVNVVTAEEMYQQALNLHKNFDVIIMSAAVSDYKCACVSSSKLKKSNEKLIIEMIKNPDIAKELGKVKGDKIHVGFCAETDDLIKNAKNKIESKNFDFIVANDVTLEGAGFGVDTNIVKIIDKHGIMLELPKMSKIEVGQKILDKVMELLSKS